MSSTGLMSCVRENSPPIEMAASESGAFSLPNTATTDSQKRRRFHPLRNLRRIFRRRTLSGADTLGRTVSSTPSSPLSQASQTSLTSSQSTASPATVIASVPAHSVPCFSREGNYVSPVDVITMSSAAAATTGAVFSPSQPHPISLTGNRDTGTCGLTAVAPNHFKITPSASGGFFVKNASGESAFGRGREPMSTTLTSTQDMDENRDIMDYQRSLSEGRLVDSDYSRDTLSQSRDSVFSESATASSLSLGLKAELFDVLRKRRNRPDASEEDLGLPRSPTTPQRKERTVNQSEVSSLSLLSMASSELDDELTASPNYSGGDKLANSSFSSSGRYSTSFEMSRNSDEIDLDISVGSRLSHSAAHHKMAVRPKKKGPTRHRRPKEPTVLPSTPEVNEDLLKLSTPDIKDPSLDKQKAKSHSLPPGVNAKVMEKHSTATVKETSSISMKRSKTETTSVSSTCVVQSVRTEIEHVSSSQTSTLERNRDDEGSFFKRFLHRSSKKMKRSADEGDHADETLPSISVENYENATIRPEDNKPAPTEVTRRELAAEVRTGLSALLNSMMTPSGHERPAPDNIPAQKISKPKSGPAARQRVQPQDLSMQAPQPPPEISISELSPSALLIENEKQISRSLEPNSTIQINTPFEMESTEKLVKLPSKPAEESKIPTRQKPAKDDALPSIVFTHEHFEKKDSRAQPKIVGLSPFQQKISRVESSTLDVLKPVPKQRKSVEKSKSFRYYDESENSEGNLKKRENMPSLPDLTSSRKSMESSEFTITSVNKVEPKPVSSMGFEINDNNLIKLRKHEEPAAVPAQGSIFTKNIILSTTKPTSPTCNKNITEIEENIDKLVKSPFVTVLKSEELNEIKTLSNVSTTIICKTETFQSREVTESVQTRLRYSDKIKSASSEILSKSEAKSVEKARVENFEQKTLSTDSSSEKKFILELTDSKFDNKTKEPSSATTPTKARRSSAFFESKSEDEQIPEFMKIQLNRVDSNRPKSNLVLSKNVKTPDSEDRGEMTRRFSNESVEITDTKPPLPPDATVGSSLSKRSSITSTTSVTKLIEDTPIPPVKSPISKKAEELPLKSPVKKVDEENNVLKNTENTPVPPAIEPVSLREGKPKYIKKIEEQKAEKRKSVIESSRETIERETGVVLRKKSFSANNQSSNNKEDTPELMKVFARRSLKIKDTEDTQNFDDPDKTNSLKKSGNLDSDKENQSSSEEKLDKLPKIEITIQPKSSLQNGQLASKSEEKVRTSITDLFRKPNTAALINTTTPKPFVQPARYSSVATYRSISTAFAEKKKDTSATPLITSSVASPTITTSTTQAPTTGSTTTSPEQTTITTDENERNNNNPTVSNISNTNNIRHTIGTSSPVTAKLVSNPGSGEFKGILQRRAEWEQRAKEASK
ncbi:nuclear pore complex protein DDB_G0274915 isoform X1 [Hermetia illucens]|uniref:nuclear pore complex protein DDB_G0274915 isoform X1 n=1 Tax=Hermetia illucens TaxID=343691 RepID=UPI0018CBF2FD|nr:nuclear pore complex protein DDB_G0274915 isoform X1 [Hermetia illucens]